MGGFKLAKGVALAAAGVAAVYLTRHDAAQTLARWITQLHLRPGRHWVDGLLATVLDANPQTLRAIEVGTFVYAAVFLVEGVGLLLRRRWAEYLTVIATASLLPLEVYELVERVRTTRALIVVANLAIVLYLIARLRVERREDRE
ncbi:MAG: DUF2127 domain-containing protein [Candidatus Rokuibacteriota bacterium]